MELTARILKAKRDQVWYYRKPDSQWTILKTDKGCCKGVVPWEPREHDQIKMTGEYKLSRFNGAREFCFASCSMDMPTDSKNMLEYACAITSGLGPAAFVRIWEKYGADWRDVRELDIPGITATAKFAWQDTLRRIDDQQERSNTIAWLMGHGCTMRMAQVAFEKFGLATQARVTQDPYCLTELPHYGFAVVDSRIRGSLGIKDDDPRRVDAAILYIMRERSRSHGTAIPREDLFGELSRLVPLDRERFRERCKTLMICKWIVEVDHEHVALIDDYEDEVKIWKMIAL